MLSTIEIFLLQHAISSVTSPEARAWAVTELKKTSSALSNPVLAAVLAALEAAIVA